MQPQNSCKILQGTDGDLAGKVSFYRQIFSFCRRAIPENQADWRFLAGRDPLRRGSNVCGKPGACYQRRESGAINIMGTCRRCYRTSVGVRDAVSIRYKKSCQAAFYAALTYRVLSYARLIIQSFDLIRMFACASALFRAEMWRPNASRVFLSPCALLMLRSHRQRLPVFVTTRRISSREC